MAEVCAPDFEDVVFENLGFENWAFTDLVLKPVFKNQRVLASINPKSLPLVLP
jgi:hypothetical protein